MEKINKCYTIQAAARNFSLLLLRLFGIGKPRALQGAFSSILDALWAETAAPRFLCGTLRAFQPFDRREATQFALVHQTRLAI